MKKLTLFLLSVSILSACNSNSNQATPPRDDKCICEKPTTKKYEIKLNMNNFWRFIESEYSTIGSGSIYDTKYTCNYVFKGVLNYAYYDNVIISLNYNATSKDDYYYPKGSYNAHVEVKLNAGGNGEVSLDYNYIPRNIWPAFTEKTFQGYDRSLSIMAVSGTVKFIM